MPEISDILILFGIGAAAGFMNVMAGGGSMLTVPALIFAGLDPTTANGTNRIAIIIQNVSAVLSFKAEKKQKYKLSIILALLTLPGAIAGAITAAEIGDELFQKILGIIMIVVIITMVLPRPSREPDEEASQKIPWGIYPAMVAIGFYGGFIQIGVGFTIMAALHLIMRMNLVDVNMHKVVIILLYTIPALLIFVLSDKVNVPLGLSLAAGNASGAWWGAKLSIKKGEKYIKYVLIIAALVMALKLLEVF